MKKKSKEHEEKAELLREFDFRRSVRGRYAGKFSLQTKVILRDKSGRILEVTTVEKALAHRKALANP